MSGQIDPEIAACAAVLEALQTIDNAARIRVLKWAQDRCLPGGFDPHERSMAYLEWLATMTEAVREHRTAVTAPSEADQRLYGKLDELVGKPQPSPAKPPTTQQAKR